jgi:Winged helix domain
MKRTFELVAETSKETRFTLTGRNAWALQELIIAGEAGCTPVDDPGPRWSAYVHNLRHEYGVEIETVNEPHRGSFPGNHGRYVLRSNVQVAGSDS